MRIVSNSSPLIALAQIDRLRLLNQLFERIYIPSAVWREVVTNGRPPASEQIPLQGWIEIAEVNVQMISNIPVDRGEAEAIVLSAQIKADYLIIDERRARVIAQQYDIPLIGTIGVLLAAKRKGYVPAITSLLDDLLEGDFRMSEQLYNLAKARAGE